MFQMNKPMSYLTNFLFDFLSRFSFRMREREPEFTIPHMWLRKFRLKLYQQQEKNNNSLSRKQIHDVIHLDPFIIVTSSTNDNTN